MEPTSSLSPTFVTALKERLSQAAGEWDMQIRRAGEGRGFLRMRDTMGGEVSALFELTGEWLSAPTLSKPRSYLW